jgi:hypothetical protein
VREQRTIDQRLGWIQIHNPSDYGTLYRARVEGVGRVTTTSNFREDGLSDLSIHEKVLLRQSLYKLILRMEQDELCLCCLQLDSSTIFVLLLYS